jgi:hypothetical protein
MNRMRDPKVWVNVWVLFVVSDRFALQTTGVTRAVGRVDG